jgi:N6-L-threonylcarbamoyladenine synthase
MTIFAVETSCDETSAAVIRDGKVFSSTVSSQIKLHAEYGGVVPELAAREHLRNLIPVAQAALREADVKPDQLDAIAATQGPGLAIALLVGFKAAQAMAFALRKPFIGINHHEAHLYSPWIGKFEQFQPNISLIASGGHTMLVFVESELKYRVLGGTIDDAAGECFDKTGKMMGLAYPAGPIIDKLATEGNSRAYKFPRPLLFEKNDDFSFSGLKTSVRYFIRDHPEVLQDRRALADLCASVQQAIVDVLGFKTFRAAERLGVKCMTVSGGVACNSRLQQYFNTDPWFGWKVRFADKKFCTDNAAMIGILAERKLRVNVPLPSFDEEIKPGWVLA